MDDKVYSISKKRVKFPTVLSKEEVISAYQKLPSIKYKAIFILLYSAGLRISEALSLRIKDIDSKRMVINIFNAKGAKDRSVMLSDKCLKVLREYYTACKVKPKSYLFFGYDLDKPMRPRWVQNIISKSGKLAKINKDVTPHILRHSFATHCAPVYGY